MTGRFIVAVLGGQWRWGELGGAGGFSTFILTFYKIAGIQRSSQLYNPGDSFSLNHPALNAACLCEWDVADQ